MPEKEAFRPWSLRNLILILLCPELAPQSGARQKDRGLADG
jgi:hypothetical protein